MTTDQAPATGQIGYELEYLCSYNATLQLPPEVIGPIPEGVRANVYITGGEVRGPKLNGKVRPVGADWALLRPDGVIILDVRTTIETDDGALIYAAYTGVIDFGPDGYQQFLGGGVPPDGTPIRAAPRVPTAHPAYQWLNRLQCLTIGETRLSQGEVRYDLYAVR